MFSRRSLDHDLDDEVRAHIHLAIEEKMQSGLSCEQAHLAAVREFGGVTQIKENYRIDRGIGWLETLSRDLRFAVRTLWKSPGFTAVVVLTLSVGIGGNTAIFSIVNGVLLNPLPFPQPAQLVSLHESKPNFQEGSISYPNFLDWRSDNKTFASMALTRNWSFSMTGRGEAEQLNGQYLSAGFFAVLGIHPLLGREFPSNEEQRGAAPAALISEGLWRRKFDASPGIIGQNITLDGRNFSVVGVVPSSFRLEFSNFRQKDVYVPIIRWDNPLLMKRGGGLGFHGIGRLRDRATLDQARADMDEVTRNLASAFPDANRGIGATLKPLKEQIVAETRPFLLVLVAAVGFVLLIACVNVASLLLARSSRRSREFAVRTALGASRGRVLRQLLTESLLLGTAAGALGLSAALFGTRSVLRMVAAALPRAEEVGIDLRVLAFTLAVSLFTGILFGLAPAWKISHANPQIALKEGGRTATGSHHRALGTLVVVEMAVALVLLAGAGLMIRSLMRLWNVDPGFDPHGRVGLRLVNAAGRNRRVSQRHPCDAARTRHHIRVCARRQGRFANVGSPSHGERRRHCLLARRSAQACG
jgi:predicted permease